MPDSLLRFADRLSARLLTQGWFPGPQPEDPGLIRCLLGPGVQLLLVDAASRSSLALSQEPLFKTRAPAGHGHRLVLYLSDHSREGQRAGLASAAKRQFLGGVQSLGLVELESQQVTLSKPGGWVGAFQPKALTQAIEDALRSPEEAVDYSALVESTVNSIGEFGQWLGQVKPFWTPAILALCVALTVLAEISGGSTDSYTMFRMGALWRPSILGFERWWLGEWWRLATCTVLHFGWVHLLVNMYSFYSVGTVLERILGRSVYLVVLIFSGVGGALCSLWGHEQTLSAGLSGALFGLAASTCVLVYARRLPIPGLAQRALAGGLAPAILYNLIYGLTNSGIDNYAHVGGMISGALITLVLFPRPSDQLIRPTPALPLRLIPLIYGLFLVLGAISFSQRKLPMSTPFQKYEISGTSLHFGREFKMLASEGVVRIYLCPGCVLCLGVTNKAPWPGPEAFVEQLKKELPSDQHEPATISQHACILTRGKDKDNRPLFSCRILDLGPDVVEISLLGEFVDGKRDKALVEAIVKSAVGQPSRWGGKK